MYLLINCESLLQKSRRDKKCITGCEAEGVTSGIGNIATLSIPISFI
jgi:hypothetical protein